MFRFGKAIATKQKLKPAIERFIARPGDELPASMFVFRVGTLDVDARTAQRNLRTRTIFNFQRAPDDKRVELHIDVDIEHDRGTSLDGHV